MSDEYTGKIKYVPMTVCKHQWTKLRNIVEEEFDECGFREIIGVEVICMQCEEVKVISTI